MARTTVPDRSALARDWRVLCDHLGERRAGSAADRRAAEFMAGRFAELGLPSFVAEELPCPSLARARRRLAAQIGGRWRAVDSAVPVGAPGTAGNQPIEGDVVWLELPENLPRLRRGALRGKFAVIFGPLPPRVEPPRRLVAAQPAAVIPVDERLPFGWAKSDRVDPAWVQRHGRPPMATVPSTDAWQRRLAGVRCLRVQIDVSLRAAHSQNVIAEIPGREPRLPALVLAAHHDTQCGNPGAVDNASGVVARLALAQLLAGRLHRRTIRFIPFGCEEPLSVGAAAYAQAHRAGMPAARAGREFRQHRLAARPPGTGALGRGGARDEGARPPRARRGSTALLVVEATDLYRPPRARGVRRLFRGSSAQLPSTASRAPGVDVHKTRNCGAVSRPPRARGGRRAHCRRGLALFRYVPSQCQRRAFAMLLPQQILRRPLAAPQPARRPGQRLVRSSAAPGAGGRAARGPLRGPCHRRRRAW